MERHKEQDEMDIVRANKPPLPTGISFSSSFQFPSNRAGVRTSNVRLKIALAYFRKSATLLPCQR